MNFLLAGIWMSLAWSLRGQFGHLKGALIPGSFAALFISLSAPDGKWRKAFPLAVILGSLGFSLGGHMSYSRVIQNILEAPGLASAAPDLWRIFLIGAIWGGAGAMFMGCGFSEKPMTSKDALYLAAVFIFCFFVLTTVHFKKYGLIAFAAVLTYNVCFKKSRIIQGFGIAGFFGFGTGFLFSVLALWAGKQGFLSWAGPWWMLRDQIFGFIGGVFLYAAAAIFFNQKISPSTQAPYFLRRFGFLWFLIFIPAVNVRNVLGYWKASGHFAEEGLFALAVLLLLLFFPVFRMVMKIKMAHLAGMLALRISGFFMIWFLSFWAIAKEMFVFGWSRWENAFSLFLIFSFCLSLPMFFERRPLDNGEVLI